MRANSGAARENMAKVRLAVAVAIVFAGGLIGMAMGGGIRRTREHVAVQEHGATQVLVAVQEPAAAQAPAGYELTWSDEFDGADGASPDRAKWRYDIGGEGWGNHELEFYTDHLQNAHLEAGKLVITAQKEMTPRSKGEARMYTSARIKTANLFSVAYGRLEARIKIPQGEGVWPAFWMLGEDIGSVGWPRCGEIDIMENIGKEPTAVHGSLHGPGAAGGGKRTADLTAKYARAGDVALAADFHVYAAEWEPGAVRFFVDGTNYATFTKEQWPVGAAWPFDHKFFLILDFAVGGDWPGPPDSATVFPQQMLVDYVRVYRRSGTAMPTAGER